MQSIQPTYSLRSGPNVKIISQPVDLDSETKKKVIKKAKAIHVHPSARASEIWVLNEGMPKDIRFNFKSGMLAPTSRLLGEDPRTIYGSVDGILRRRLVKMQEMRPGR